jgi:hypothetical protein
MVRYERGRTMVEPPDADVVVEGVVVAAHELDGPARVAHQEEDHVADGRSFGVAPLGDTVLRTRWRWGRLGSHLE